MIIGLIIGEARVCGVEVLSPHEAHPARLSRWVDEMSKSTGGFVVCTFSPIVIRLVVKVLGETAYEHIRLRPEDGPDINLLDAHDRDWLAHFALEDLYLHGELAGLP